MAVPATPSGDGPFQKDAPGAHLCALQIAGRGGGSSLMISSLLEHWILNAHAA